MAGIAFGVILAGAIGQEGISWRHDYEAALAEARASGRLVLVHFRAEGRPLAAAMSERTFRDPRVARRAAERFVCVNVEVEARPELFREAVGTAGGLATCVFDAEGDVVGVLPGFAEAEALLRFLRRTEEGYPRLRAAREDAARRPAEPGPRLALGEAYEALGSARRAEACFRKVLELAAGEEAAAHERLARLAAQRGRNVEAREHLAEYRRRDPQGKGGREDRALLTEALVLSLERRPAEAARRAEEALAAHPAGAEADRLLLVAGWSRHEAGEDARAVAHLEELRRRFPDSPWADLAAERLAHIRNPDHGHEH
ncbi:MAG TPA: thioredoxin family protein [Planctomycetota bacterium]|nr:thioredoxin family protein [Planctomycetota bacterium]